MNIIVPAKLNEAKDKMILLDQTLLPTETRYIEIDKLEDTWDAIKKLRVRGAPAIGVAAGFGIYLGVKDSKANTYDDFYEEFMEAKKYLASSRPTAVNLFWALNRMEDRLVKEKEKSLDEIKKSLLEESEDILREDQEMCKKISEYGLSLLKPNMGLLTHCNAGGIATSGYGTALGPMYLGHEKSYGFKVFSDETRPLNQGSRLTAWELNEVGIDVTVICDDMASIVMKQGKIDAVLVGCDRVAANGDVANKIGTSGVAILAKEYNIPFYVLGPTSTIDMETATGDDINIELRDSKEIYNGFGKITAPPEVKFYNPAFDVTDHKYITAIITEKGIVKPPYDENLRKIFQ
ncbi:methylthioribose-1-phosphate isomerase 1 [Vallitalea longa]|uniref:Methylthioribose-1-phosphate isomerase n=1 Tax=Vallitalea longa TaxID=2936439 RepID=A0A9W5YDL2_9FIRM|nr:S-methyl-5-thioribose-1-phosphate isomerase [Vallitalea longa]GKX30686.1 methylthioribose-1-phosphate isomerase 1 [Vallitalea longa]